MLSVENIQLLLKALDLYEGHENVSISESSECSNVEDKLEKLLNRMNFKFELNDIVRLIGSDEQGIIVSRAEHTVAENNYMIRYKCGDGRLTESWWTESALVK